MAYDDGRYQGKQIMTPGAVSGGMSIPGTAAADTVLVKLRMPRPVTIDAATSANMTGGTAAGPVVLLQKSLAGTGAGVTFGSYLMGTAADASTGVFTVTSTAFASGDALLVTNLAGTAAATPKMNIAVEWKETFTNA